MFVRFKNNPLVISSIYPQNKLLLPCGGHYSTSNIELPLQVSIPSHMPPSASRPRGSFRIANALYYLRVRSCESWSHFSSCGRTLSDYESERYDSRSVHCCRGFGHILVEDERIELSTLRCKRSVFPLALIPQNWRGLSFASILTTRLFSIMPPRSMTQTVPPHVSRNNT